MNGPLQRVVAAALNHVVAQAPWAQEALLKHTGSTAAFAVAPFEFALRVDATGTFQTAGDAAEPDLRVELTPGEAVRVMTGQASVAEVARIDGDAAFGATLRQLAANLRWDFEEDLSKVVGDIAAHRAAGMLRSLAAWPGMAGNRLGQAAAEFATEEAQLMPSRHEFEAWLADVDHLRDDAERLEKRIARLEAAR